MEKYLRAKSDELSLFPGEHWFFYWRSSPSLWKGRIQEEIKSDVVIIPINWSAHCVESHLSDFGQVRPEADLKKLHDISIELGLSLVFLFPLGPCPFLSNGGLPTFISSTPAINKNGEVVATIDNANQIHKMYSFYEPRVFQHYSRFLSSFKNFLKEEKILAPVVLAEYGYVQDGEFQSYFVDRSSCFTSNFRRYVALKEEEGNREKIEYAKFDQTVLEMYLIAARQQLKDSYSHLQKIVFLAAGSNDFHARVFDNFNHAEAGLGIVESVRKNLLLSTSLLNNSEKDGFIKNMSESVADLNYLRKQFRLNFSEDDDFTQFCPLFNLNIVSPDQIKNSAKDIYDELLMNSVSEQSKDDFLQDLNNYHPIHLIETAEIDEKYLNIILRRFLDGQKIILKRSSLTSEAQKRLDLFIHENGINVERIMFKEKLTSLSLNLGRIIILESECNIDVHDKKVLWSKVLASLEVRNLHLEAEKGLLLFWKTRTPSSIELKFEEIKRLYLYNPSSYKLNASITTNRNYFLLKKIDEINCKVDIKHPHINLSFLPKASIALDFGYIAEGSL